MTKQKLIIRADDLGMSKAVNYGIYDAMQIGCVTAIGFMSNMEDAAHGAKLMKDFTGDIGLHVNISVGRPISLMHKVSTLVHPKRQEFYTSKEIRNGQMESIDTNELTYEIIQQIEAFKHYFNRLPDYIDGHGISCPLFLETIKKVAQSYALFYVDPNDEMWLQEQNLQYIYPENIKADGMYSPYENLSFFTSHMKQGENHLMIFHPGYMDIYVQRHTSYTDIRMVEAAFLQSDEFMQWLKDEHIELCSFHDCRKGSSENIMETQEDVLTRTAMQIILSAGDARIAASDALALAKIFSFEEAERKMELAQDNVRHAHQQQTKIIQDEARGIYYGYSLLFTHAQDTLMTINSEINFTNEMIEILRIIQKG